MPETYLFYLLCFDVVRHASPHPVTSVAPATLSASHIKRMFKNTTAVCFLSLCCIKTTYHLHSAYIWSTVLPVLSIHLHFLLVSVKLVNSQTFSLFHYFFSFFFHFFISLQWNNFLQNIINPYDKTSALRTGFETLPIRVYPNRCLITFSRSILTPEKFFKQILDRLPLY